MPAMPMAESKPPMVVGIRQTSSATSTVIVIGVPCPATLTLNSEYGNSVAQTTRKMMVKAASRILSAISLGVFCRLAPSTMSIIRSRKPLAGVGGDADDQPVGEDARAAGHGAAVAAAFADDGRAFARDGALVHRRDAFDDLAVCRDDVAGFHQEQITLAQQRRWHQLHVGVAAAARSSFLACVSWRVRRSASAWALPRPSAMASEKLANSTVNQSHKETATMKPGRRFAVAGEGLHATRRSSARCRLPRRTSPGSDHPARVELDRRIAGSASLIDAARRKDWHVCLSYGWS